MKASEIMATPVHVVDESCSLEEAARKMLTYKIGCLPVVNADGQLTGIVTESDFAAKEKGVPFSLYRFPQVFGEWMPKQGVENMYAAARSRTVGEVMTRHVVILDADDGLEAVLEKMLRTGYHRLPVTSGGVPIGIVARHDLLRLMVRTQGMAEA